MVSVMVFVVGVAVLAGAALFSAESGARAEPYTQVVDNATKRFDASRWGTTNRGAGFLGENYRFAAPSEEDTPARFKVKIPKTGLYNVYARWPKDRGFSKAARIGVVTPAGDRWTRVDQRDGGDGWVKVGTFNMEEGDRYSVEVSRDTPEDDPKDADDPKRGDAPEKKGSSGERSYVVADAVKVQAATEEDLTGKDMVREARSWMDVKYSLGDCSRQNGVDCSCLTQKAYGEFGISLPDDPGLQYAYGRDIERSEVQAGDLVFFKEHGQDEGFTHVGMATGEGTLVHATTYTGDVTVGEIDNISGYAGAKRILGTTDVRSAAEVSMPTFLGISDGR